MSHDVVADQVWRAMSALVLDNKDAWRRAAVESTGLPFSRIRIVKRLSRGPMTVKEVAEMATIDAPAATVAVNDLEARGLVTREINPSNRRCKLVSLTAAGHDLVDALNRLADPPPPALAGLEDADLEALRAILDRIPR
ncbi:MAG: MarR family transcriptional regulator [Mycobacterium sp.]